MKIEQFTSKHFNFEKVKDGVYAAMVTPNGGGFANSGIIDLGDQTIVFDTFNTPQAAYDLKEAAKLLTGKPITCVVNSHWHGDHIRGNQQFEDTKIISTEKTKELMETIHPERIAKQQKTIQQLRDHIQSLTDSIITETDRAKIKSIQNTISQLKEIEETLPTLKLVLPTETFEGQYILKGSKREVHLLSYGGGHTSSDLFLFLPEDGVIFSGDLLVVKNHPYMADGKPDEWITIINKMLELSFETVIPGHGKIGGREDLLAIKEYLQSMIQYGLNKDESLKEEMRNKYYNWKMPEMLDLNLEFISSRK